MLAGEEQAMLSSRVLLCSRHSCNYEQGFLYYRIWPVFVKLYVTSKTSAKNTSQLSQILATFGTIPNLQYCHKDANIKMKVSMKCMNR